MEREDAEEYTAALGLIAEGAYRKVALGLKLGIPKALGMKREDWVARIGTIKMSIQDRQEAVKELTADGLNNSEIADVLGVDEKTIRNDRSEFSEPTAENTHQNGYCEDEDSENSEREWEDHEPEPEQIWTADQLERKTRAENGECVVANVRQGQDDTLLAWARDNGRFVRIDRQTDWGNPFEIPEDGDRDAVVLKFSKHYFPYKTGLMRRLPDLRGKVLGCWCHPETCHGHIIADYVNRNR